MFAPPKTPLRRADLLGLSFVFAAILAWTAYPWLWPGHLAWDGDSLLLFHPAYRFAHDELWAGRIPLWNPHKFLGAPFLANLIVPVFYPPLLVCLLLPQPFGLHFSLVLHLWLAGGLTYGCARHGFRQGAAPSAFAAITFALSAPLLMAAGHPNQLYTAAWLPGILWWTVRAGRPGRAGGGKLVRDAMGLAAVLGMQGLAAHPQMCLLSGLILAGGWVVFRRGRLVAATIAGGLLALGVAAVHWMPAAELSPLSHRVVQGPDYALSYSLTWRTLWTLLTPSRFGAPGLPGDYTGDWNFSEMAIFFGQAALLLGLMALVLRRRRRHVWLLALLIVPALVWALGKSIGIYPYLINIFTPLQSLRAPARSFILVVLCFSILSSLGLSAIIKDLRRKSKPALIIICICLIFALQLYGLAIFQFGLTPQPYQSARILNGATVLSAYPGLEGRVSRQLVAEIPVTATDSAATARKRTLLQWDINSLHGVRMMGGYDEGMLPLLPYMATTRHFWRNIYTPTPDTQLLGLMGVELLMADKPVSGAHLQPIARDGDVTVYRNMDYRGEVFTRDMWPGVELERVQVAKLGPANDRPVALGPGSPPGGEADVDGVSPAGGPSDALGYTRTAPGRLLVDVRRDDVTEIFLSETALPGWIARNTSSGEVIAGEPFAAFLMRFELPPRRGRWEIQYRPASYLAGRKLSSISVLLIPFVLTFSAWLRRRRRGSPPSGGPLRESL